MQRKIATMERQISQSHVDLSKTVAKRAEHEKTIENMASQREALQKKYDDSEAERSRLHRMVMSYKDTEDQFKASYQRSQQDLQNALDKHKDYETQIKRLENQVQEHRITASNTQSQLQQVQQQLQTAQQQAQQAQSQVAQAQAQASSQHPAHLSNRQTATSSYAPHMTPAATRPSLPSYNHSPAPGSANRALDQAGYPAYMTAAQQGQSATGPMGNQLMSIAHPSRQHLYQPTPAQMMPQQRAWPSINVQQQYSQGHDNPNIWDSSHMSSGMR